MRDDRGRKWLADYAMDVLHGWLTPNVQGEAPLIEKAHENR